MKPITSPLKLGQTGTEVANLQEILLAFLNEDIITTNDETVLSRLAEEYAAKVLGSATVHLVKTYRDTKGIDDTSGTELMNPETIETINEELDSLLKHRFSVSGSVQHVSGKALPSGYEARICWLGFRTETELDIVTLGEDGSFTAVIDMSGYDIDLDESNGIRVDVRKTIEATVLATETIYAEGNDFHFANLTVEGEDIIVSTEFKEIGDALVLAIGSTPIADVDINNAGELELLSRKTGENVRNITLLVKAFRLHSTITGIAAEDFYGILRQNMPDALAALAVQPEEVIRKALEISVTNNVIHFLTAEEIEDISVLLKNLVMGWYLAHPDAEDITTGFYHVAMYILDNDTVRVTEFLQVYEAFYADGWEVLAAKLTEAAFTTVEIGDFRIALRLILLTENVAPLVIRLLNILKGTPASGDPTVDPVPAGPEALTSLALTDWNNVIDHAMSDDYFFFPEHIAGELNDIKKAAYAAYLYKLVKESYPTHAMEQELLADTGATAFPELKSDLGNFMLDNPEFDFRTVSVNNIDENDQFDFEGVSNKAAFIEEAATVQRLMVLTSSYPVMTALSDNGLKSSMHIVQQTEADFVTGYEVVAGSEEAAKSIYDAAQGNVMFLMNAVLDAQQNFVNPTFKVLQDTLNGDAGTPGGGGSDFVATAGSAYAEWRSLFGSLDGCNCSHCQSVYSPSAYLTDLLHFLKAKTPALYNVLSIRRPDIRNIELTCKNTNTPVPHIDIVNELLEDLVSSGPDYKIYARTTVADAKTQRAVPEYLNTTASGMTVYEWDASILPNGAKAPRVVLSPYNKLRDAVYPWNLPYNFYKRQIDTHLGLVGIKGHEISQRISVHDVFAAWSEIDFSASYLNISSVEMNAIHNPDPALLYKSYGIKAGAGSVLLSVPDPQVKGAVYPAAGTMNTSNWVSTISNRVDVFLQQTGLTYTELMELLDCYSINPLTDRANLPVGAPERPLFILSNDPGVSEATCQLDKLKIVGATATYLDLIHRFTRLKRALGWTNYELDKAMLAISPRPPQGISVTIDQELVKKMVQVKELAKVLKVKVEEVVALWGIIEGYTYKNYQLSEPQAMPSEYDRLFRNPLTGQVAAQAYPFNRYVYPPLNTTPEISYIAGIFNVAGSELQFLLEENQVIANTSSLLLAQNKVDISLAGLSLIRRQVLLMHSLNLTATELIRYRNWIAADTIYSATEKADPFADPLQALRFVYLVKLSKESGLSFSNIEYILADDFENEVAEKKTRDQVIKTLTGLRAELRKKSLPGYDAALDTDGKILQSILLTVMNADKATSLMDIIQRNDVMIGADMRAEFLDNETDFFFTSRSSVLDPSYVPVNGRALLYDDLHTYINDTVLRQSAITFLSKELKIAENLVSIILNDCLNAPDVFIDLEFINGDNDLSVPGNAPAQFLNYYLLYKASILVNAFKLNEDDISAFWSDNSAFVNVLQLTDLPVGSAATSLQLHKWITFLQWMEVRKFVDDRMDVLYDVISDLPAQFTLSAPDKPSVLKNISIALKMNQEDLDVLLGRDHNTAGVLGGAANDTAPYKLPSLYLRIIDCLEMQHLLPSPMTTLLRISAAVQSADKQSDANEIIQAVKSQYDEAQWPDTIRPVNDALRTERRDAMVAYLLANPPQNYAGAWFTVNDIYETLMVDVEMMSCMATTRVLLAVNTIQLWVDRVLLNLESDNGNKLALTPDDARQWQLWRKLYRVWEANRKIFVYPENWIEPELRDDKSPFFKELEKFLKQNDLTDANVEEAYKTYLERLDEVAHLDVVGMYRETKQADYSRFTYAANAVDRDTIHVFGRTPEQPHIYYYRKRVADEWTPWEKMDVQIDGDHFVPVMYRGRLRFYWAMFTKDQAEESATGTRSDDEFVTPAGVRWKINLAWTEYKNGKWTPKQMSKDALYSRYVFVEDPVNKAHILYYATNKFDEHRNWNFKGDLEKIRDEYISFYCEQDPGDGSLKFRLAEKMYSLSFLGMNSMGSQSYTAPNYNEHTDMSVIKEIATDNPVYMGTQTVRFGYFRVKINSVSAVTNDTDGTVIRNIYTDDYGGTTSGGWDLPSNSYKIAKSDFWYFKLPAEGYSHWPDSNVRLLTNAPGHLAADKTYQGYVPRPLVSNSWKAADLFRTTIVSDKHKAKYVVLPRVLPANFSQASPIQMPYFFYKDYNNTFFVEAVDGYDRDNAVLPSPGGFGPKVPSIPSSGGGQFVDYYARRYRFHNFRYNKINDLQEKLFNDKLEGLLSHAFTDSLGDKINFEATYQPTNNVRTGNTKEFYPDDKISFSAEHAYGLYNWELFFHIPMLIANKLTQDQKFDEARRWYHFVFNPTVGAAQVADFWNFKVFNDVAAGIQSPGSAISDMSNQAAVDRWANAPFKPHLIARTRTSSYMKNTVMKYLDNLVGWGDMLFRTDTRENINEATLLYTLAAQLLGRRPAQIPARATPADHTFASLDATGTLNAFSNAVVKIENLLLPSRVGIKSWFWSGQTNRSMNYFCIPPNDKMFTYWDTLSDRLFKIRNCRNTDGIERELALFDPPIDPALLVKAAAAGISLSDALNGANAPLPLYRFNIMSQKATELTQEVKSLGSQLLSALEKQDAERLSLLRSSQEMTILDLMTEMKERQVEESVSQINGLQQQQKMTTQRRDYYKRLVDGGLNAQEQLQLDSLQNSIPLALNQGVLQTLSGALSAIPNITIGAFSSGAMTGGGNLGPLVGSAASAVGTAANIQSIIGSMAATKSSFTRRKEEWQLQLTTSETELKQLEYQVIGAQIRREVAEMELRNHQKQVENARVMDEAMRNKYTNEDLYEWMVSEISLTYFQAYKLALDVAKRAERCYSYELGIDNTTFIRPAYWDSLRKGLLAGEQLMFDIKRMEASYLDKNKRHLELSKHISLATLAPDKLIELKLNKHCTFDIREWMFDMDYPGHHMRRIKSVSVSIPCIAGPYTTVSCKLSLISSKYRLSGTRIDEEDVEIYNEEGKQKQLYGSIQSIATSHAQNDSGMFEFSFRDERYLPFEGAGAISTWKLELPSTYAQFDFNSISDVIIHMNYTALDEGGLTEVAKNSVKEVVETIAETDGLMRLFSLKHEFSNEWHAYKEKVANNAYTPLSLRISKDRFPYFSKDYTITATAAFHLIPKGNTDVSNYHLEVYYRDSAGIKTAVYNPSSGDTILTIKGNVRILKMVLKDNDGDLANMDTLLEDVLMVLHYTCTAGEVEADDEDWADASSLAHSKMQAWWKADMLTADSSGNVNTWEDQAGSYDLTPAGGTAPVQTNDTVNGIKPVYFHGGSALYTGNFPDKQSYTATVLVKIVTTDSTGIIGRNSGLGAASGWSVWLISNYLSLNTGTDGITFSPAYLATSVAPVVNTWEYLTYRRDAAAGTLTIWKNGTQVYQSPCAHEFKISTQPISIGSLGTVSGNYGDFKMLETIICESALTDDEINLQHEYLRNKYDLS